MNTVIKALEHNYVVCVINHRGTPGTILKTPKLYNAASSDDVWQALKYVWRTWPAADIYALGYSLGANLLTKYLGEEGDKSFLVGASAISNPWNFNAC